MVLPDATSDPRLVRHPGLVQHGIHAYIAVPLLRPDGSVFGTLCALDPEPGELDATSLDVLHTVAGLIQHELAAQERAAHRERWLHVLAHDLRSPLASIDIAAQALTRQPAPTIRERLHGNIRRGVATMQEMIDALMAQARHPSPESVQLERRPTVLEPWLRQLLEDQHLPDVLEVQGSLGVVQVDPERLGQALRNLVGNAKTYSTDGTVAVVARGEREAIFLQVANPTDSVVERPENLFHPYVRGVSSTGGLGLGLFLCRLFVRAHGGEATACIQDDRFIVEVVLPRSCHPDEISEASEPAGRQQRR